MRICVKDLSGLGSKHDPLSVTYVVIGGLHYVLFLILLNLRSGSIFVSLVDLSRGRAKRKVDALLPRV